MNKFKVLLVDDDDFVLSSLKNEAELLDIYEIETCNDPARVLEKINQGESFDAYLIDQKMPNLTGVDLIKNLVALKIEGLVYIITAEDDGVALKVAESPESEGGIPQIKRYIPKPWPPSLFSVDIRHDLEERELKKKLIASVDDFFKSQKKVEGKVQEAQKRIWELESTNRAKSEFLANVSHELRTPLHGILSFADFGKERADILETNKVQHYFEEIHACGEELLRLINDLLDISKLESGRMDYEYDRHNLNDVIQENINELTRMLDKKQQELVYEDNGKKIIGYFDRFKIKQVVRNLLANAMNYNSEEGTIWLSIDHVKKKNRNSKELRNYLEIVVSDNGVGIPPDELGSIFDKFTQSSKTKSGSGGTGLGLAICRQIVNDHKGAIWAENNPEGGARFLVLLPSFDEKGLETSSQNLDEVEEI